MSQSCHGIMWLVCIWSVHDQYTSASICLAGLSKCAALSGLRALFFVHKALQFWPILSLVVRTFSSPAPHNRAHPRRVSMPSYNDTDYIRKTTIWKMYYIMIHTIARLYIIIQFWFSLELSVRLNSEEFLKDGIIVSLEWTLLNSQSYHQQFLHNISVSAVPQLNNVMFTGDMRAQLTLSYNTLYNVSVTQHSTCRQLTGTTFIELSYSKL